MIKKIYGKHTFYFSIFAIILSVTALLFGNKIEAPNELMISFICLFLILSIGISHGAMDNYKANKLLEIYKKKNKSIFFIIYISISVMIILLWSLYPTVTLLMFLIIASYHFGREDTSFLHQNNYYVDQALYLIKGSLIVFAPLFFHIDETIEIFETLLISDNILFYIKKEIQNSR